MRCPANEEKKSDNWIENENNLKLNHVDEIESYTRTRQHVLLERLLNDENSFRDAIGAFTRKYVKY